VACDQLQSHYDGMFDAGRKILKADGVRGLYRGVGTALAGVAPFSALNFTSYEMIKEAVHRHFENPPVWLSGCYGAAAGTIAMTGTRGTCCPHSRQCCIRSIW